VKIETKTDILKSLADSHRSQFDQRRTIEWRIIFATLGFYRGTTAAVLAKDISLPITWYTFISYIALAFAT
jgi:hypothetical protein